MSATTTTPQGKTVRCGCKFEKSTGIRTVICEAHRFEELQARSHKPVPGKTIFNPIESPDFNRPIIHF